LIQLPEDVVEADIPHLQQFDVFKLQELKRTVSSQTPSNSYFSYLAKNFIPTALIDAHFHIKSFECPSQEKLTNQVKEIFIDFMRKNPKEILRLSKEFQKNDSLKQPVQDFRSLVSFINIIYDHKDQYFKQSEKNEIIVMKTTGMAIIVTTLLFAENLCGNILFFFFGDFLLFSGIYLYRRVHKVPESLPSKMLAQKSNC